MEQRKLAKELHRLDIAVGRKLHQESDVKQLEDVTCTNLRIIRFLNEHSDREVYQRDLEKEFGITRSTASRVLMLMEQKGLIERHSVKKDARLKKLVLTEKSRAISASFIGSGRRMDQLLLEGFSPEETGLLFSFLDRMLENVK